MFPERSASVVDVRRCSGPLSRGDSPRCVVWLRGEHDLATVAALSEALALALVSDHENLVVDLSEVEFMGAATIGVFRRASELLRLQSRALVLRSPSRRARRVLKLCGDADLTDPRPFAVLSPITALGEQWRPNAASRPPRSAFEPGRKALAAAFVTKDARRPVHGAKPRGVRP